MTTSDLERQLRDELQAVAATTTVAPDALATIVERAERAGARRVLAPSSTRPWRTRLVVLAAVAVLAAGTAVLVGQAGSGSDDDGTVHIVDDPPTEPPALVGHFAGSVEQNPCAGDCLDGILVADLADLSHRGILPGSRSGGTAFLADGRHLEGGALVDSDDAQLVDDSGVSIDLGRGQITSVKANADGDLAMLVRHDDDGPWTVRTLGGPGEDRDTQLPDWLQADALDLADDGSIALIGREGQDPTKAHLYLLGADGSGAGDLRFGSGLETIAGDRGLPSGNGVLDLSISPWGTYAISLSTPEPLSTGGDAHPGWTAVIDRQGNALAVLDEWQGLAWSPDGAGLLTARRLGTRTSELRVWYGRDLAGFHDGPEPGTDDGALDGTLQHLDVGEVSPPVMPLHWGPPEPTIDLVPSATDLVRTPATINADGQQLFLDGSDSIGVIGFAWNDLPPLHCIAAARLTLLVRDGRGGVRVEVTSPLATSVDGSGTDDAIPDGSPTAEATIVEPGRALTFDALPFLQWARANLPEGELVALSLTEIPPPEGPIGDEVQRVELASSESGPGPALLIDHTALCGTP